MHTYLLLEFCWRNSWKWDVRVWLPVVISRSNVYKYCVEIKCVCACCRWRFVRFLHAKKHEDVKKWLCESAIITSCHYLTQHSSVVRCIVRRIEFDNWGKCFQRWRWQQRQRQCQSTVLTHAHTLSLSTASWAAPNALNASNNNIWHRSQMEFHVRRGKKCEENKTIDKITSMTMALTKTPPLSHRNSDMWTTRKKDWEEENARFSVSRPHRRAHTHWAEDKSIELRSIDTRRNNWIEFCTIFCLFILNDLSTKRNKEIPLINVGKGKSIKPTRRHVNVWNCFWFPLTIFSSIVFFVFEAWKSTAMTFCRWLANLC